MCGQNAASFNVKAGVNMQSLQRKEPSHKFRTGCKTNEHLPVHTNKRYCLMFCFKHSLYFIRLHHGPFRLFIITQAISIQWVWY